MLLLAIAIFGIINLMLSIYATLMISRTKRKLVFIWWWAFINGSFVWEDMLVFGLLHFAMAMISISNNNPRQWLIGFLIFWIVRSAGETLYFFLQQFVEPQKHPLNIHNHFVPLRKLFGDISDHKCFVIMQVVMQSVLVLSSFALITLLVKS